MDPSDTKNPSENELLLNIRQKNRADIHKTQLNKRLSTVDRQRCGLTEISATIQEQELLTEKDVQGLSSRIKRRKAATSTDLKRLSAAFLHNPANIETFSKIPGALNVIVKEFSGTDTEHQVLAAECLCNLALGDDVCCKKLAQAAGSYLILYLDCVSNKLLVETSLWVIQNLLLSGEKTRKTLIAQGVAEKIVTLMHGAKDVEIKSVAEETFAILVVEAWKELPEDFTPKIVNLLIETLNHNSSGAFYAFYTTLMELNFNVDTKILEKIVKYSTEVLIEAIQSGLTDFSRTLMAIRIITNSILVNNLVIKSVADVLNSRNCSISDIINALISVENEQISHETLWMASSLIKLCDFGILEQELRIPAKYL